MSALAKTPRIMVESRGGISGGLTIADALHELEDRGYTGQFVVRPDGAVECQTCCVQHRPSRVPLEAMRRVEGASDPSDMVFVGALRCPHCGSLGTTTLKYGPEAPPEVALVLRELENQRAATLHTREDADASLVSDTGWLPGPDGAR